MIFNSFEYLLFLPIVFLLYWFVCSKTVKWQNASILIASYFFYVWWDWKFLALLLTTTLTSYLSGKLIAKYKFASTTNHQKKHGPAWWILMGTIVLNIGILFFYKYFNFFIQSFIDTFSLFGKELTISTLKIILPIGISFYTFTALSYTFDVYKGKVTPIKDWMAYFSYVSFFPALFCGPIGRAEKQLPQFLSKRTFSYDMAISGCKLMLWGFFMKLCVADRLGIYVDAIYDNIPQHNGTSLFVASFFYAFQLYCDFGGYSLLAIGSGKLLGINLQENFRRPYLATSFSDYWKRNHISLTEWLMDYIYYPMVGSSDKLRWWNFCMIITFLASGLWHGAAWVFIIWGLYNGIWLVISANNSKRRKKFEKNHNLKNNGFYKALTIFGTFAIVWFGLIFFRANNVGDAFEAMGKIFTQPGFLFIDKSSMFFGVTSMLVLIMKDVVDEYNIQFNFMNSKYVVVRYISVIAIISFVLLFGVLDGGQFIYFQF